MRALPPAILALLLAGCATPEAGPVPTADPNGTALAGSPEASVDDGTKPMPADVGHMPHMHDYWEGRERVTLFDDTLDPTANEDPFMPLYRAFGGGVGMHAWRLPDEKIVMEGTGQMDIAASWSDPAVTSLGVMWRVGASAEWSETVPLPNGETVTLEVTPAMTDMPHTSTSRWDFLFVPADSPGMLLGPFDLKVDIVKLRDIMLFPGHPELFEGKPEKLLHDLEHEHAEVSYPQRAPNVVTQGEFGEKTVTPANIVPMETLAMRVEVTILDATATPGEVTGIRFFYRGADTSYLGHPYVIPLEGSLDDGFLAYQFPVTMEQTDSPYAKESQWLFFVEPVTKFTGEPDEPECGGCTDVSIRYHLKIVAYDHELEEYSKMEGEE